LRTLIHVILAPEGSAEGWTFGTPRLVALIAALTGLGHPLVAPAGFGRQFLRLGFEKRLLTILLVIFRIAT